jgi:ABC-type branched-subunit amino acid transport system ATPase component
MQDARDGPCLMLSPSVLVLDRPTTNLALMVATQLLEEYVRGFADHRSSVLLVEQRARAALRISDWTYVLGAVESSSPAPRRTLSRTPPSSIPSSVVRRHIIRESTDVPTAFVRPHVHRTANL